MNMVAETAIRKLREMRYLAGAREILATPPVVPRDDGVILFSMIGTKVLLPYLVAAKSLHCRLGMGRFAILDDGTLTANDREVLAHHLGNPQIYSIADVDPAPCPSGGCWERLLTLLELRRDHYVIQLDSDTVTFGPVPDVAEAIARGRNFTLKGEAVARWMSVEEFVATPPFYDWQDPETHVQDVAEALLPEIAGGIGGQRHYVRGCAGFAGFAPGGLGPEVAKDFCTEIVARIGLERWSQWGSEQVMSNVIVSNEGEPVLLPYDRFLNFWNEPISSEVAFVHFIGTYRYHAGAYLEATRQAIAAL
ncbi:MAG: hypothetical protein KDE25_15625 [Novosphingobium sp.]|nr:hypothetical protein [Novosphingobium sp.]